MCRALYINVRNLRIVQDIEKVIIINMVKKYVKFCQKRDLFKKNQLEI